MQQKTRKIRELRRRVKPRHMAVPLSLIVLLVAAGVLWELTPLAEYASADKIASLARRFSAQPYAPYAMIGIIILSQLVFMPLIVMTLATAMVFGPIEGIVISLAGACTGATITYGIGHFFGRRRLRDLMGPVLNKVKARIEDTGIAGLIALRFVPVAPYSVVNIALGVFGIPYAVFITASFLELLPGCVIRSFLGGAISDLWRNPDRRSITIVAVGIICWACIVLATHFGAQKWKAAQKRRRAATA